ncbi:female sterile (2) ltoPP43 [Glossina fuscipes fuscipes]
MPAVVRVKRRIDEEPLSAFVLNGKRRRLGDDNASFAEQSNGKIVTSKDEISTLLKFAGTLREQDDTATTEFARLTKTEAKEMVLQKSVRKPSNCTEKARQEMRRHLHEQRFRVVNCLRTTLETSDTHENPAAKNLTIVDIEKQQNDKAATLNNNVATNNLMASTSSAAGEVGSLHFTSTDTDTGYVYDLYLPDNEQQADYVDLMDDNYLRLVLHVDMLMLTNRFNMPAVVRVKRRIDEEPLSAFVLNGKRRRLGDDNASFAEQSNGKIVTGKDEISTLLKFAGTLREQDDTATTEFARLTKTEAKEMVLQKSVRKPSNCTEKARQEMRRHLHEQRFRVVNCLRTTLETSDTHENPAAKNLTIVDIEKQQNDKAATLNNNVATNNLMASTSSAAGEVGSLHFTSTDTDTGYVYDLYLPDNEQQADYVDLMDDNYLSIRPFDDLVYEDCYNNEDSDDKYDSEDSNEENYFANDYPDEDDEMVCNSSESPDEYDNEKFENLSTAMNNFVFGKDDEETDSSSSSSSADNDNYYNSYEDPYIHTINFEDEDFCEDVDYYDAARYGVAYARYKARHVRMNTNALSSGENVLKANSDDNDEDDDYIPFSDDSFQSANENEREEE